MTNIVKFKNSARKKLKKSGGNFIVGNIWKKQRGPANDAKLIRHCIAYSQAITGYHAGFKADPDGDSFYSTPLGDRYLILAQTAMKRIASISATSAEGLEAKARLIPIILNDDGSDDNNIEELSVQFFRTLAADMQKFLEPIMEQNWQAAVAATKAKPQVAAATA